MRSLRGRQGALLAACAVVFVAIGAWIFYNTNVVNEYLPSGVVLTGCQTGAVAHELTRKSMELFAREVMPHLRDTPVKSGVPS